jgi:hypothetical protein
MRIVTCRVRAGGSSPNGLLRDISTAVEPAVEAVKR